MLKLEVQYIQHRISEPLRVNLATVGNKYRYKIIKGACGGVVVKALCY